MAWWTASIPHSCIQLLLLAQCALLTATPVVAKPQVVSLPIYRNERRSIVKRDTITANLRNDYYDGMFWINATVGTPGQLVQLQIDTGSSDIWMMGKWPCLGLGDQCLGGSYDEMSSSTSTVLDRSGFTIGYVDGSGVEGDYVRDDFSIGGVKVQGMTLAVATRVNSIGTGVMGIGFESDESIAAYGGKPYKNLVDRMVEQGLIKSRSYSLWLNDINAQTGNVLFGGYDTAKFHGDLVAMKVQPDAQSGQITSMTVAWTSLSVTDPTHGNKLLTSQSFALPAVLDSGTTLTYVPQDLYDELASFANVVSYEGSDTGFVDCNDVNQYKGTLDFGFGGPNGPVISVPFSEMIYPFVDSMGTQQRFRNGHPACYFGIAPAPNNNQILFGDTFLRSAYVVYDLERKEIAIAKTNFNSQDSNIVEISPANSTATPTWKFVDSVTVAQTGTVVPERPGEIASSSISSSSHSYTGTGIGFHMPTATSTSTGKHNAAVPGRAIGSGLLVPVGISVISAFAGAGLLFAR
ncbi:Aspartic-type endopeptidase [Penicillium ucsense]|uniref:penicillopepsin n=1 Tax=Penicillium ucsense TaxID=2839758 RepID=A0A8J8WIZ5_9EURO|nr:Aspartic-type endopeptidase [Penicillium ucsense]KAF7739490.1 Aspartic-type endopeptidase [Penicillium ucsense]